jgi:hypothetical protein
VPKHESAAVQRPLEPKPVSAAAEPSKAAAPKQGVILNAALAAAATAGIVFILQRHWPWLLGWAQNITPVSLLITGGGIGAAAFVFAYLVADDVKALIRSWAAARRARIAAISLLVAEGVAVIALELLLPVPHIVRIVPGPQLDLALGDTGQILQIEVNGKRFELASPPPRALYAGANERRLRYEIGNESKDARQAALKDILLDQYGIEPNDAVGIDKLLRHFTLDDPVLMTSKGASGNQTAKGTLTDAQGVRPLTLSKVNSEGIETYVADFP